MSHIFRNIRNNKSTGHTKSYCQCRYCDGYKVFYLYFWPVCEFEHCLDIDKRRDDKERCQTKYKMSII